MAETEKERLDRELIELLNELRVALPGVQVLFAFLLVLPFQQRFERITGGERGVYFAALMATTLSTALMIAPSAFHRLRFRDRDKKALIFISNWLTIGGLFSLAVALVCSVFLVTHVIYGGAASVVATVLAGLAFAGLWLGLPLARELRERDYDRR